MLLVCVFNVDKLIFNHIFEIGRLKAKLLKVANKVPIYRVESLKDVEKTEITSSSFVHASNKEMLYSSTYEPDERMTNYKSYMEALPKLEEIQQWHSVIRTEEAEKEQIVR